MHQDDCISRGVRGQYQLYLGSPYKNSLVEGKEKKMRWHLMQRHGGLKKWGWLEHLSVVQVQEDEGNGMQGGSGRAP